MPKIPQTHDDLSGAIRFSSLDAAAVAPDVTVPVLFAGSESDSAPSRDDVEGIAALAGSDEVELWFAERGHGWALLAADDGNENTEFRLVILGWITGERRSRGLQIGELTSGLRPKSPDLLLTCWPT